MDLPDCGPRGARIGCFNIVKSFLRHQNGHDHRGYNHGSGGYRRPLEPARVEAQAGAGIKGCIAC